MVDVNIQTTIGPYKQEPVCTRPLLTDEQLDSVIAEAVKAQKSWKKVPIEERVKIAEKWVVSSIRHGSCFGVEKHSADIPVCDRAAGGPPRRGPQH